MLPPLTPGFFHQLLKPYTQKIVTILIILTFYLCGIFFFLDDDSASDGVTKNQISVIIFSASRKKRTRKLECVFVYAHTIIFKTKINKKKI